MNAKSNSIGTQRWVAVVLICILADRSRADEVNDLVDLHRMKLESIEDIHLRARSTNHHSAGNGGNYEFEWLYSSGEELVRFKSQRSEYSGDFTGMKFTMGNSVYYSGSDGFIGLKEFDGQLDQNGELPADSLASVFIGKAVGGGAGIGLVDARGQTGMYVVGLSPPSKPVWEFVAESRNVVLEKHGDLASLKLTLDDFSLDVTFDTGHDYLIRSYSRSDPYGHTRFDVEMFTMIEDYGWFPARVRCTVNGEPFYSVETQVVSLNQPQPKSQFKIDIPMYTPFFEEESGKSGVWGTSGPDRYFATEKEGIDFVAQRKMNALSRRQQNGSILWMYVIIAIASLAVLVSLVIWKRR